MKPQIVIQEASGYHNLDKNAKARLEQGRAYQNISTACLIPTRGTIAAKVVQNWWGLLSPMNQKFMRFFVIGLEVGEAYCAGIEMILNNPDLSKWKYLLTLEEDNMPPPDGLLKLYEGMSKFDVVGGLYWTKGPMGQPMIYGNPNEFPYSFTPQIPVPDCLQPCNGLGMGFTLFKIDIFKDPKVPKPWFKTVQEHKPNEGTKMFTQDLYFFDNIHKLGYKVACDTRVKVGHYDLENDMVW